MRFAGICLILFFSMPVFAQQQGQALGEISTPRDTPAQFTEIRMNALLKEPLQFEGELLFSSDGTLSKVIHQPVQETVIISTTTVQLERRGKKRVLPIQKMPDLAELYAGLRALLDGNLPALQEIFSIEDVETGEHWTVNLTPKSSRLQKTAPLITASGLGNTLREIRISQTADEWQIIRLNNPTP
jgi:hypothetical protein